MEKIQVGRSCGVLFGGNANNGSNAGFAYANSNNAPSNANANIGSHLCFSHGLSMARIYTKNKRAATLPLGKKFHKFRKVLVDTPPTTEYRRLRIRKAKQ